MAACKRNTNDERFVALRHTIGGAVPWWDANGEERDKKHNSALVEIIKQLQVLFIERTKEWTTHAAAQGWRRQGRWNHREWSRLILAALKRNTIGRHARLSAYRRIGSALMNIYRDEGSWLTLVERKAAWAHHRWRVRMRLRRTIWSIYYSHASRVRCMHVPSDDTRVGAVEGWVDRVHHAKGGIDEKRVERVTHAMRCMVAYTRWCTRPREIEEARAREWDKRDRHARWLRWAKLMRYY